jgi:hypothetical protein
MAETSLLKVDHVVQLGLGILYLILYLGMHGLRLRASRQMIGKLIGALGRGALCGAVNGAVRGRGSLLQDGRGSCNSNRP